VRHPDAGLAREDLRGDVRRRPVARRAVVDLARVGARVLHEAGQVLARHARVRHEEERDLPGRGHRQERSDRIEIGAPDDVRRDHDPAAGRVEERVAVRVGAHHGVDPHVAVAAAAVLHHEALPEGLRQPRREQPGGHVGGAGRRDVDDDVQRLGGPGLRLRPQARARE